MPKRHANQFRESTELSEVNVTPLADVCLTLVIMFMIVSPMALQALIQVQAAQAVSSSAKAKEKPLFVDITVKGFTLNQRKLGSEYELYRALQRQLSRKRDKTVLISSASDVRYQFVVRVLDIVKQSGARSLSLVPRKKGRA